MPANPFDKSSRYAAKMDPESFLGWALGLPTGDFTFDGWLDTRAVPLPHEPDQIGDTVARVRNATVAEAPWAIVLEFQSEPDPLMFGRLLIYLGHLWQSVRPDAERGSRFGVAAVVVNLTGTGEASRDMRWAGTPLVTQLGVAERDLAGESADDLLTVLEGGRWSRALLPWIPLMTGGADPGIIDRWKALADGEPDSRRRGTFGSLALVFADAAGRQADWKRALEGWNVVESAIVNEWKAEARVEQAAAAVVTVLGTKYGQVPPELEMKIRRTKDLARLQQWLTDAVTTNSRDEFQQAAGL